MSFADSTLPRQLGAEGPQEPSASKRSTNPLNDINSPNGKIGGAAQKQFSSTTVLHHVTMAYDVDADKDDAGAADRPRKRRTRRRQVPASASTQVRSKAACRATASSPR